MSEQIVPRPEVMAFARAMEMRLQANEHLYTWRDLDCGDLCGYAAEALRTLEHTSCGDLDYTRDQQSIATLRDAADLANFCLAIADAWGALGEQS